MVGRVARINAFEAMFTAMLNVDVDVDIDLAPHVGSSQKMLDSCY